MPELPEVETLRRGLDREARGRRIADVVIANPKTLKDQSAAAFRSRVVGAQVERVDRRGKYLLIPLLRAQAHDDNDAPPPDFPAAVAADAADAPTQTSADAVVLCIHLKMRGQLLVEDAAAPVAPYHCATLVLEGGREIRFHDLWTWGEMRALTRAEMPAALPGLCAMGAEPLEPGWNGRALSAALGGRRGPIKPALLDQKVVAGVGNIYADESLFRAGIHPERPASTLSPGETDRLAEAIRTVLGEALEGGGTTSDDYVDVGGAPGRYTPRVYDRGGAPCQNCGASLARIRLGGRGTVFCPRCQT